MSASHPGSEDLSLPDSLASMCLSSAGVAVDSVDSSRRESQDSECDTEAEGAPCPQAESLSPTTSTSLSSDASSPTSSLLSHSRDLSFEEKQAHTSNASTPTNGPLGIGHMAGDSGSPSSGGRGTNDKRPSQYDNRRNLHVDNLPPMTEVEFRNLFLRYGAIARSRIVTDAITGLHAGYGFVMFEHEEDALLAMHSLHNTNLPNSAKPLRVTVKKPKTAKAWEREREKELEKQKLLAHGAVNIQTIFVNTNLYVAGLPANWTKREMDEIFSQFGMILESRILLEKHSHVSKGVGFVRFQQLECCHQAIQALNGKPAPLPPSLEASGKGNASAANPNGNREDCKQNLTVRFAVDKTAQALAVAQQTVMGTLNQQRSSNVQHNTAQQHHAHSHSEVNAAVGNQNYLAVMNNGSQQSPQRSNSPRLHTVLNAQPFGGTLNGLTPQQIQSLLAIQQQQFARAAALATVNGGNRASFSGATAPNVAASTFAFAASPAGSTATSFAAASPADYSAYSLENAFLLSQLNSPLTSSALSFNSLAAAGVLTPINALPSMALAPPATNAAALNQFYAANSIPTLPTLANQVFV